MGFEFASETHPIKGVVILSAVVVAIFALVREPSFVIDYQLPRKRRCGKREITTHNFLEMALAKERICDFDSCGGHDFVTKEDGCSEVVTLRLGPRVGGGD